MRYNVKNKWTSKEEKKLLEYHANGMRLNKIAYTLGRPKSGVYQRLMKLLRKNKTREQYLKSDNKIERKNKHKKWTKIELKYLKNNFDWNNRYNSIQEIADYLGRTFTAVRVKAGKMYGYTKKEFEGKNNIEIKPSVPNKSIEIKNNNDNDYKIEFKVQDNSISITIDKFKE